jgi:hypothetical protein
MGLAQHHWLAAVAFGSLALAACGDDAAGDGSGSGGSSGAAGTGGLDPNGNQDGDCLTNGQEIENGTDPTLADTDGDGSDDCAELDCNSPPADPAKRCYACGWKHGDPGNLVSTGATEGNVIENIPLVDQCGETVPLWDLAGEYQILFMTTVW